MKVIDQNAPLKKPWITKGILASIIKKYILLKKNIKSNDELTFLRYKTSRDKIKHLIRIRKTRSL